MRVALLSDIHGNLVALDAVLADMARLGSFDEIVVAGDLVWSGPWPGEVVDRIRSLKAAVIQGNTDAFFSRTPADTPTGKHEERFAGQLGWMREQLGLERTAYLANLPFSHRITPAGLQPQDRTQLNEGPIPGLAARSVVVTNTLLVVHANPFDLERAIRPQMKEAELDELLGGAVDWGALAFGHIHIPFVRQWRGRLLIDVASAGLPMDNDRRAVYAILTWDGAGWQAEHRRVSYHVPVVAQQMRTCGMPRGKHFAERLMSATYGPAGLVTVE